MRDDNHFIFFSIVIPAHNEEGYIDKTLNSLKTIDYPKNRYEVIVVENGSTDSTNKIIEEISQGEFKVLATQIGKVSVAKNVGLKQVCPKSDWIILLDADTYFGQSFLQDLKKFLLESKNKNLSCGMVSLLPYPDSRLARSWYHFYNFANNTTRTTRSIQVLNTKILITYNLRCNELLTFDEDTQLIRGFKKYGKYFYFITDQVFSSTRRFDKNGWIKQLFIWISWHFSPYSKKMKINYPVVR
jgi:glycosyltransferase involved in cell wall biosynthesis